MEKKNFKITEKGIVLCEVWKLQKITMVFSSIIILLQIILLTIMLSK